MLVSCGPVYKRKNSLSGCGMKKEDFDKPQKVGFNDEPEKIHEASSKMFFKRRDFLLENRYIKQLESKGNRDKYYGITPIGISYYCRNIKKLHGNVFEKIISCLRDYYETGKPKNEISYIKMLEKTWNKLTKIYDESELLEHFKGIVSGIEISDIDIGKAIECCYETYYGLKVNLAVFQITKDQYRLLLDSSVDEIKPFYYDTNESEFYYNISKFIIRAFAYDLIQDNFEDQELIVNSKSKIKELKNLQFKSQKIPLEIFGLADEFNNELRDSIRKHNQTVGTIGYKIKTRFTKSKIKTIHEIKEEKEIEVFQKQWNTLYEIVEQNADNKRITKSQFMQKLLKTNRWKNKDELKEFWKENKRRIRRIFVEEGPRVEWIKPKISHDSRVFQTS